ncbi:MAG TPA: hypothetical protein VLE43_06675, partial [Candidatus Saccharimonadia bacterium]|nr:hypothetical protein [Candidatus Saccharimonadia bacterium]
MPRRRLINGVLRGFLGTFTSRYSDYEGYWLFGFLVDAPGVIVVDLLSADDDLAPSTPVASTRAIAIRKFRDQVEKSRIPAHWIASACLELHIPKQLVAASSGSARKPTIELKVATRIKSDLGRIYMREAYLEASPHDPRF